MKGKVSKLLICMMVAAFLAACGNNQADVPVTDSQVQEESTSESSLQESSETSSDESQVAASSAPGAPEEEAEESAESSVEKTTEAALESVETKPEESTKELVAVETSKEAESVVSSQETVAPSKESEKSSEAVAPSQEVVKSSVEQSTPSQEASKPSASTPSVEQTQPSQEQSKPSEPAVHTCSYGGGTVTTAATCNTEGVKTYSCSCGKTKTESIPTTNHNYVSESQAATCSAEGFERTKCSICGDVKSETILGKTDHDYYEFWWHEPTCVSEGYMHLMKCHNCDYQHDLPLGALGHLADAGTVYYAGTCISPAKLSHNCTRCGATLPDTTGSIDPNNHNWAFDEEYQLWYCRGCHITK